jgi:uncharacterized metal-binding protein YceD (DUF177 family)
MTSHPTWSVPIRIDDIPEAGRELELDADAAARAAVAAAAGVNDIPRLHATFELARRGNEGLRVVGTVSATVRQTCVVTLDPLENEIEEEIDLVFVPARAAAEAKGAGLSADAAEPPEVLVDGAVDLGAIATEFLILGIDPYPRKAGAVFEPPPSADPGGRPFAALAALRTGRGRRGG